MNVVSPAPLDLVKAQPPGTEKFPEPGNLSPAPLITPNSVGPPTFAPYTFGGYFFSEGPFGSSLVRCVDISTAEEYSCKVITLPRHHDTLRAHARLSGHPQVNPLLEVMVGRTSAYLRFPRSHTDLHTYVRARRRLPEAEARPLVSQIVGVVAAAHQAGVVLRDLKLRKFVFKDANRQELKLESLEDTVVLENPQDDLLNVKHGCPAYVSPEVLSPTGCYSGRAADCWSLGVLMYAMLVGRYPFHDTQHSALFSKIRQGTFIIPDSISPRARCLIRSLIRRDASERLTAEEALRHPWFTDCSWLPEEDITNDQCVPDID